jgi:DNA-binding winged helix-turn-helix (wHTH) protein
MPTDARVKRKLLSSNGVCSLDCLEPRKSDSQDAEALLQSIIRLHGEESLPRPSSSELIQFENYRIGLVPVEGVTSLSALVPLALNADKVLILPLTWKELVSHLRAKKAEPAHDWANESAHIGSVEISFSLMEGRRFGVPVHFTALQFKVLHYFVKNPGRSITREELLSRVWGYAHYPTTRTVDNTLLQLRRRLEPDPAKPIYFRTVHGVGYKFTPRGSGSSNPI